MLKRLSILCILALLSAGLLGCEAKTRYHVLCFLFDGVPTPPGMVPCDGNKHHGPGAGAASMAAAAGEKEIARTYSQHGPFAAKLCEGCHQRQTNKLLMAKDELCFNCHVFSFKNKKVHGPVAAGGCTICHDPHGSPNKYLLVAKSQEFCLYCHQREDLIKNSAHLGMETTGCTICHNAHASDNDYLLRESPGFEGSRQKKHHEASPDKKQHEAGPDKKQHEAGPDKKQHEAGPDKKQHEAGPDKKQHEAGPDLKQPKQQLARLAKESKISTIKNNPELNKPEQDLNLQDAPIKWIQAQDTKVF